MLTGIRKNLSVNKCPGKDKESGRVFDGPEDLVDTWGEFAAKKFDATENETERAQI